MPTNRTRRAHRRRADVAQLTVWQFYDLLHGHPVIPCLGFADVDEMADAWEAHAERILALWIQHFPGRRPFAWWMFDAPDERRLLPDLPPVTLANLANWREHGILSTDCLQKPEEDHLRRHGLLTPDELRVLAGDGLVMAPWSAGAPELARELAAAG